jgi:hypothetical protein
MFGINLNEVILYIYVVVEFCPSGHNFVYSAEVQLKLLTNVSPPYFLVKE